MALLTLATTGSAVAHLVLPAALGRTLDLLLADPESARTHHWLLGCVALTVAIVVLDACDVALTAGTNARATAWIRRRAVRHTLDAGPRSGGPPAGDLVARLVGSAAQAGTAPAALAATFSSVITPVGGVCALALIDPWTAVGLLVGLPLFGLLLRGFVRDSGDSLTRYQRTQGEIAGRLTEALDGARTIAAAGTARREISRVLGPLPALSREGHRVWRVQSRSTAQAAALVPMLQITVIAVAGIRLDAGALSVGSLLAASRYAVLATGFGGLVGRLGALVRARTAAARVAELLAAPVIPHGDRTLPPGDGTVELRAVTLSTGGRTVLDGVDLALPGGTSTAVVGRSGAGKSALAAVAGRLADPDRGTVLLDGVPLPELTRAEIRGAIAYAFARPALLGGTLHGTIALGVTRPPASGVARAARAACADGFISRLPDGYATPCAGVLLSGGEIQRLGLARAFAHDGRLMVLDDATSSLDSVTELRVARALAREEGHRTRLIVAHRATTAARADRVVWLEEGRVRAVAPHAELWRIPDYRAVFAPPDPDPERDPLVDTAPVPGPLADAVPGPGRTSAGGGAQRPGGTGTFAGPGPSGGAGAGDADG
ncbi:ABC transporter ATP-binding protein [Streptomyces pactum]|uniref:ABC transporter ATP-binding protein n=1 Tax=Streptomyces pactum TaxID=68249 RepID=UPI0036FD9200